MPVDENQRAFLMGCSLRLHHIAVISWSAGEIPDSEKPRKKRRARRPWYDFMAAVHMVRQPHKNTYSC